jgi:protein-arginine kinase activator protein McsA
MTEEQMEQLANLVVDKLIAKQREYDDQFHIDIQEVMSDNLGSVRHVSEEELLLSEIAKLMTLLSSYEDKEQYEKAAIIKNKLDKLKNRLDKL